MVSKFLGNLCFPNLDKNHFTSIYMEYYMPRLINKINGSVFENKNFGKTSASEANLSKDYLLKKTRSFIRI